MMIKKFKRWLVNKWSDYKIPHEALRINGYIFLRVDGEPYLFNEAYVDRAGCPYTVKQSIPITKGLYTAMEDVLFNWDKHFKDHAVELKDIIR